MGIICIQINYPEPNSNSEDGHERLGSFSFYLLIPLALLWGFLIFYFHQTYQDGMQCYKLWELLITLMASGSFTRPLASISESLLSEFHPLGQHGFGSQALPSEYSREYCTGRASLADNQIPIFEANVTILIISSRNISLRNFCGQKNRFITLRNILWTDAFPFTSRPSHFFINWALQSRNLLWKVTLNDGKKGNCASFLV